MSLLSATVLARRTVNRATRKARLGRYASGALKISLFILVAVLAVGPANAQPPSQAPTPSSGAAKSGADPTDFITRYEPSYEHKDVDGGVSLDLLTLRADFALRPTASVRLDLPLVGYRPDGDLQAAGFNRGFSLGDLVMQVTLKPYSSAKLAAIYGLRLDLDTGTTVEVAQGGTTYSPLGAVAFSLPHHSLFVPVFNWFLGSDLDNLPQPGTRDINRLSLRPLYIWQPGKKNLAYLLIDPELIWDFETDDFTGTLGIAYGKAIGRAELLTLKTTVRLTDGTTNWGIQFAFRHMFPGRFMF